MNDGIRPAWKEWMPVLSLALVLIGAVLTGGGKLAQLDDVTRRVAAIESAADKRADQIRDLQVKVAGIDGKIDLLLERVNGDRR